MDTVSVIVLHYYNYPIYYPWMSKEIFDILEKAFLSELPIAEVPKKDFEEMVSAYLDTLKN